MKRTLLIGVLCLSTLLVAACGAAPAAPPTVVLPTEASPTEAPPTTSASNACSDE